MAHIYTDSSSTSITNLSAINPKKKDQFGAVLIGLIGFLGLGYVLFNPTFPTSHNFSGKRSADSKVYFSAASLNAEKTATLFDTAKQPTAIGNQLAVDSTN